MDYDLYYKLKRGNYKAFRSLYELELKRLWFICYHITQDTTTAAPLLIQSWNESVKFVTEQENQPFENFSQLVSSEIFKRIKEGLRSDESFEGLSAPKLDERFDAFVNTIKNLSFDEKSVYLLSTFGGISISFLAKNWDISASQARERLAIISSKAQDSREIKNLGFALSVRLSAEFKNPSGSPFLNIDVPEFIITTLEHDFQNLITNIGKGISKAPKIRKESDKMKPNTKNNTEQVAKKPARKTSSKYTKPIVITTICLVVVIAAAIILPKVLGANIAATRIITYNVEAVTQGNVTQTISGSGTLTPIKSETLTSSSGGEVEKVNYSVGDAVEEDAVIAVIDDDEITAPFDGILIELPLAKGDEVAKGGSVAMIMSKDGFTMGIAVDETEISDIKLKQDVTFTIDAMNEDYEGQVTAISYNGSSSGGSVAYQITAKVEYIEGVYPGMSASAQIVIEDSGEGLLVPVDAVSTSGDENYVYLAPSGSEEGTVYEEDEIDASNLTKVSVQTGMSDGTYMIIESEEISEGDLIVITKTTSTLTGSESEGEEEGGRGGMGGFPGGGGMDFGDFDFENFDTSQMPGGGGGMGGFGG